MFRFECVHTYIYCEADNAVILTLSDSKLVAVILPSKRLAKFVHVI